MKGKLLPEDILQRIHKDFPVVTDRNEILHLFECVEQADINVGIEQLQRSILVIAAGDVREIKQIFKTTFYGDPRDVIMIAEAKVGYPGSYGSLPFQ
jgi:hypothetical protein